MEHNSIPPDACINRRDKKDRARRHRFRRACVEICVGLHLPSYSTRYNLNDIQQTVTMKRLLKPKLEKKPVEENETAASTSPSGGSSASNITRSASPSVRSRNSREHTASEQIASSSSGRQSRRDRRSFLGISFLGHGVKAKSTTNLTSGKIIIPTPQTCMVLKSSIALSSCRSCTRRISSSKC